MKLKTTVHKNLLKYLVLFLTIALFIPLIKKINWKLNDGLFTTWNWVEFFLYEFLAEWIIVVLFMIAIYYVTNRMIHKNLNLKVTFIIHVFLSFLLGFLSLCTISLVAYITGFFNFNQAIENISFDKFLSGIDKDFLIYFSSIAIIYIYNYVNKVRNVELQKSQLQTQLAENKLNMLKAQIHPHFMFNTLNSISTLVEIDPEKAQNLIADFGNLFRTIIEFEENDLIPLEKDMSILNRYIDIISVRFSDHLIIKKQIDTNFNSILVPNMLIQPIVENAIKHGYSYNNTELEILIKIEKKQNYLHFYIENNGQLLQDNFDNLLKKGTGLKNTYERLKTLYNKEFELNIFNKEDLSSVILTIKIPVKYRA